MLNIFSIKKNKLWFILKFFLILYIKVVNFQIYIYKLLIMLAKTNGRIGLQSNKINNYNESIN